MQIDSGLDRCCAEVGARYLELFAGTTTAGWESPQGTVETLEALSGRVRLALLTGNPEPIARARTERLGLARFFPEGQGAFGCEREDRSELIALARERAGGWPADRTVEVGDTPTDVASARAAGIRSVAVCWGRFDREELAGADAYVDEMPELLRALPL